MKRIYFTVTNDLTYDQRMHRICTSLAGAGYAVTLVGRRRPGSRALQEKPFRQKRLRCLFGKGPLFYAEYNLRLFFYLLFRRMDGICAIDLDTILPCYLVSRLKRIPRIYDAHEYFTELKEVRERPRVQGIWRAIEKATVPRFRYGYTVSEGIAREFKQRYGVNYALVRNMPLLRPLTGARERRPFLVYQGAVNEGRCFEQLIPALREIPYTLVVCGDGNFMPQLRQLIAANGVADKVVLKGMLLPDELWEVAQEAALGICLVEREGLNQLLSLPNKFFDYMHAGLPQIAMAYPEYEKINHERPVAVLIAELTVEGVAGAIRSAMQNEALRAQLAANALAVRERWCWNEEEKRLIQYYQRVFND